MNKILIIIKNILLVLLVFLISNFMFKYYFDMVDNSIILEDSYSVPIINIIYLIPILLIFIYIFLNVKDIIKKSKINNKKLYNILCIIVIFVISIVFIRMLYDSNFLINYVVKNNFVKYEGDGLILLGIYYYNNILYIIILIGLLLTYRKINLK